MTKCPHRTGMSPGLLLALLLVVACLPARADADGVALPAAEAIQEAPCVTGETTAAPALSDEEYAWARDVMLGSEYGTRTSKVRLWGKSPRLRIVGGEQEQRDSVEACVTEINSAFVRAGFVIQVVGEDEQADILVYLAPTSEFDAIGKEHGFKPAYGNAGLFWTWWSREGKITKAVVMLGSDVLHEQALRHFALEEISQCLGFFNDSPRYPDSVFYAKGVDGGVAQKLSEADRKLIIWTYSTLGPGAQLKRDPERPPGRAETLDAVSP